MCIKLVVAAFDVKGISPTEKLVLLSLAEHASPHTRRCYPSVKRVADRTSLSERAVQVNIKKLIDRGIILLEKGGGRGRANDYLVNINPAPETPFEKHRFKNTVSDDINPAPRSQNPAPDAPQTSLTVIEPERVESNAREALSGEIIDTLSLDNLFDEVLHVANRGRGNIPRNWMPPHASLHVSKWVTELELSPEQVIQVVRGEMSNFTGDVVSPKFFDASMKKYAAVIKAEPMRAMEYGNGKQPYHHQQNGYPQGQQDRLDPALENINRLIRNRHARSDGGS